MATNIAEAIKSVDQKFIRTDLPEFEVGDTVKMKVKVQEADKMRLHPFEGTVIRKTGRGIKGTFTVRKISYGEGVERVFPIHSPVIESLEVVSKGIIKQARLYYLRDRVGKQARVKKRQTQ
ncbi:MAG: 50S ribosomal protein L19 [Candidatus Omnitrophica bacterium]|nr:50S ribosomal protein L19 [Candidatus Omnitrophota bacterium]